MRRSLFKVARADAVKACSSKRRERHVVGVWFPALVKQARLEDFKVMCIESRSNLGDLAFLRKMQHLNDCVYPLMRESRETVLFE